MEVAALFSALTIVLALSQGSGTASLEYVRMPVKVGFKCAKLIPTMLFGACLTGRRFSLAEYAAAAVLCCGLALMSLADYFDESSDLASRAKMVTGVQLLLVAIVCDALVPNLQERLLAQLHITMDAMVFYSNLCALCILGVTIAFSGELALAIAFCAANPVVWTILACQAIFGYCGLCCYLAIIRSAGGVMGVVTTSARKGLTLLLSFITFAKPFGIPHAAGLMLLVLGIGLIARAKQQRTVAAPDKLSPTPRRDVV